MKKTKTTQKNKLSFSALLHNNKFVFVFSVLISVTIWFGVTYANNNDTTRMIYNVPVTVNTDTDALKTLGLDAVGSHQYSVDISIRCKKYQSMLITAKDIITSVSLSAVTEPNTYEIPVSAVRSGESAYDFSIESISPSKLTVTFDRIKTAEVAVTAKAIGAAAAEGLSVENAVLVDAENTMLTVQGPESTVTRIVSAAAEAKVNKTLGKTESFTADIILYDDAGAVIEQDALDLSFTKAQITVPISKRKEVSVVAAFLNIPEAYKSTPVSHTLSVEKVTVSGPPEIIDEMTTVSLEAIDFGDITPAQYRFTKKFDLPSGVKLTDSSVAEVRVNISNRNLISKTLSVTKFNFIGLADGKTASVTTTLPEVVIAGMRTSINALNANNVFAELDLSDKTGSGEYEVVATIKFNSHKDVWSVKSPAGQYTVFVKIS